MQLLPKNALETLEFNRVLELIAGHCHTPMAKDVVRDKRPSCDFDLINRELDRAANAMRLLDEDQKLVFGAFPSIAEIIPQLAVDGYVLEPEQLLEVMILMQQAQLSFEAAGKLDPVADAPILDVCEGLTDLSKQIGSIGRVLDNEGNIKPDASPELKKIAAKLIAKRQEVDKAFQVALRTFADKGWLADTGESLRNGRRVLAVKAESKRRIRGIMHDQSATGKTTFIEPEEVIELNNDVFELHAARRAEEYRLLKELCDMLRPYIEQLKEAEEALTRLDSYFACANFSMNTGAARPSTSADPGFEVYTAYHPLLRHKNQQSGKKTVPFDLILNAEQRLLLLSGPNAGGKSILMKSVGLLQVMVQSGFPVPVDSRSKFGIYTKLCVEIGDKQSLEDDLSTYSSRLMDLREFVAAANAGALILIDEFGSGTDPKLGGAIAEGALDSLNKARVQGVVTTHYSELKAFAHQTEGIVNGAMIFDRKSMSPTYMLRVGKPGSSFAFEIAARAGLPEDIIQYARERAGKDAGAMEELIAELDAQRVQLERDKVEIERQRLQLEKLTANYDAMHNELTAQRKRMRLEQKERDYQHLSKLNRELEKAVRKAREAQNLEEAKEQLEKVKTQRAATLDSLRNIKQDLDTRRSSKPVEWKVGDTARIRGATDIGRIESIDRNNANLIIGQLRMRVPLKDLEPAGDPLEINPHRSVNLDLQQQAGGSFNSLLDIRGMRVKDADDILQRFLDSALLAGVSFVEIVHGKGSGALKKLVAAKLREYPVKEVENPEDAQGGSGMTIARF